MRTQETHISGAPFSAASSMAASSPASMAMRRANPLWVISSPGLWIMPCLQNTMKRPRQPGYTPFAVKDAVFFTECIRGVAISKGEDLFIGIERFAGRDLSSCRKSADRFC